MPYNQAPPEIGKALPDAFQALAASPTPPDSVLNFLSSLNSVLNGLIGVAITVIVVAFFVYLVRWVIAPDGSDEQRVAGRGSFRAMMGLFLAVDIWWIMKLVGSIIVLSPLTQYAFFLASFILLTCWSLFGITDGALTLLGKLTDWILDTLARAIYPSHETNGVSDWSPHKWSKATLRLLIISILMVGAFLTY